MAVSVQASATGSKQASGDFFVTCPAKVGLLLCYVTMTSLQVSIDSDETHQVHTTN